MRNDHRRIVLWGVPLVLASLAALQLVLRPFTFRTSLYDLVGDGAAAIPESVRNASADLVPVLVGPVEDPLEAIAVARAIRERVAADICVDFDSPMAAVAADRYGLASLEDIRLLTTAEGRARIARTALRRYITSPVPPFFPPAEDPFALADGFVRSLFSARNGWRFQDGLLVARTSDGKTVAVLPLRLSSGVIADTTRLEAFYAALDAAITQTTANRTVSVAACGVPLHTAVTAANCRREVNALTAFSLVFITLLAVFAFRGVRWILLLVASLVVALLAGTLALRLLFPEVHLLTVVFGTTLLGLVIDYSFHWLLSRESARAVTRNLVVSWLTTEISLVPLMLSSLPILRQSAVFLGVGLAAALAYVVAGYPREAGRLKGLGQHAEGVPLSALRVLGAVSFLAVVGFGIFRVSFGTDLTALYRPPANLAAAERLFAELSGSSETNRGFLVFDRETVAADIVKLETEQGARQRARLGVPAGLPPVRGASAEYAISSVPRPSEPLPKGVRFLQPQTVLGEVLARWTDETLVRLGFALGLMLLALAVFCRRRAFEMFLPSVLAILAVMSVLGALGEKVNLFHLLACFLLAGMSVDYTVFLHHGGHAAFTPAFCSLLTSLAGFGALVFVSFPVVQSFGFVLGLGLPVGFVAALLTRRHAEDSATPADATTEVAATPLGLETLWWIYRLLGLRALHLLSALVGLCAWTFSPKIRRATSARKLVHFTRSLADKLVVMASGRKRPSVVTDGSADAEAFLADVQAGRGVFVLSSHCGTVEVLAALEGCSFTFHAWMDFDRTSVYNRFYLRHANRAKVVIHPIAEVGMETAFLAGDALERGDCLVMAGDRGRGAFRFAHAMGHPVYFVACVWTGQGYRAIVRRLPEATQTMESAYQEALAELVRVYPEQLFTFR